jgi:hypothetical protein
VAPAGSKRIFTTARASRWRRRFITLWRAGRPPQIAMCDAGVTTFCEKPGTLQCWWSAVFLLTRAKQRWRKALLTVKSSQKKLQPASAAAAPSRAHARQREWRRVKAFRCNRTSIKPELRNQRAAGPSVHTKRARGGKKSHRNQAGQKQKRLQKVRRDD